MFPWKLPTGSYNGRHYKKIEAPNGSISFSEMSGLNLESFLSAIAFISVANIYKLANKFESMNILKAKHLFLSITLLLFVSVASFSQIPDFSKTLYKTLPEDSVNITYLINHGVEIKNGQTVAWFPKDSLSNKQMNGLLDTINLGIRAAEKFIGAPLSWQYYNKKEPYNYFFRLDSFISRTNGNFINIRFQLVRQGRAPWLHEALHSMLEAKADDSIPGTAWKENMPQWLVEGLPEYISREVYNQFGWSYFDLSKKSINNIDSACREDLKDKNGRYALSYIGKRGYLGNVATKENRKYVFAFYHCSCSFTKYLVEQKGLAPVLNSFSASPYIQQNLEKSIGSSLDTLKESWLEKLQISKSDEK